MILQTMNYRSKLIFESRFITHPPLKLESGSKIEINPVKRVQTVDFRLKMAPNTAVNGKIG